MSHFSISPRRLIRLIASFVGLLIFQEIFLRICFPFPDIKNLDRISYLERNGKASAYTRNLTRTWESQPDTNHVFTHEMNLYGFRDAEWPLAKTEGKKRVLFIGDSFVEGIMAEQDETITAAFQAQAGDGYEVFNAGMVGQGLDAYLQLLADLVPLFRPDHVILCIYANDLGKSAPTVPEFYLEPEYANPYQPRFLAVIREGRRHGAIRPIWDGERRSYLPAVPDSANPWTTNAAQLQAQTTAPLAEAMQTARLNPYRTNALAKEEHYLRQPPKLGETIPFFQYICEENQAQPFVVYLPSRNQATAYYLRYERELCRTQCDPEWNLATAEFELHPRVIGEQCVRFGVPFLDLLPTVRAREAAGDHLYWKYDEHMRGRGYRLLGTTIWDNWPGK
ncbi:MAG: SGNH/GDSL hydrolase family protein [Bacteroidota bacterium]